MDPESIGILKSIDASLKQLVTLVKASRQKAAEAAPQVATDRELDSPKGDPFVKFMPRDWTGPSFKNRHFSECPSGLLDMLADSFAYFARKNDDAGTVTDRGTPKGDFDRRNERLARGWAQRNKGKDLGHQSLPHAHSSNGATAAAWAEADDGY